MNAKIQEPKHFMLNNNYRGAEFLEWFPQEEARKLAVLKVERQMQDLKIKEKLTDQGQQTEMQDLKIKKKLTDRWQQTEPVRSADFLIIIKLF